MRRILHELTRGPLGAALPTCRAGEATSSRLWWGRVPSARHGQDSPMGQGAFLCGEYKARSGRLAARLLGTVGYEATRGGAIWALKDSIFNAGTW